MTEFRGAAHRISTLADSSVIDSTLRNVRTTSSNLALLTAQVDSTNSQIQGLLAGLNSGRGSAGMLLRDTTLYSNVRNLIARMDSLVTDFEKNPKKYINVQLHVF
jgi:phospholipid/cholesterol/gamma-HCH transport system substrate-binding protein